MPDNLLTATFIAFLTILDVAQNAPSSKLMVQHLNFNKYCMKLYLLHHFSELSCTGILKHPILGISRNIPLENCSNVANHGRREMHDLMSAIYIQSVGDQLNMS